MVQRVKALTTHAWQSWLWSSEPMWRWKERSNPTELSSDLHMHSVALATHAHLTHTTTTMIFKFFEVKIIHQRVLPVRQKYNLFLLVASDIAGYQIYHLIPYHQTTQILETTCRGCRVMWHYSCFRDGYTNHRLVIPRCRVRSSRCWEVLQELQEEGSGEEIALTRRKLKHRPG